jgi:hypothetical protein
VKIGFVLAVASTHSSLDSSISLELLNLCSFPYLDPIRVTLVETNMTAQAFLVIKCVDLPRIHETRLEIAVLSAYLYNVVFSQAHISVLRYNHALHCPSKFYAPYNESSRNRVHVIS